MNGLIVGAITGALASVVGIHAIRRRQAIAAHRRKYAPPIVRECYGDGRTFDHIAQEMDEYRRVLEAIDGDANVRWPCAWWRALPEHKLSTFEPERN